MDYKSFLHGRKAALTVALTFMTSIARAQDAPDPQDMVGLARNDDYPVEALAADKQGDVIMSVKIAADGRVQSCTIRRSSGSSALDKTSCDVVRRRQFVQTAKRYAGRSATVEVPLSWKLGGPATIPIGAYATRAIFDLRQGKVVGCREKAASGAITIAQLCQGARGQAELIAAKYVDAQSLIYLVSGIQGDHRGDVRDGEGDGDTLIWRQVNVLTIDPSGKVALCEMPETPMTREDRDRECDEIVKYQQYEPLPAGTAANARYMTEIKAVYITRNAI